MITSDIVLKIESNKIQSKGENTKHLKGTSIYLCVIFKIPMSYIHVGK